MREIPQALIHISQARQTQDPFEAAFWEAHRDLAAAYEAHHTQGALTRDQLFEAYDRRMEAGYAWNPSRQKLNISLVWLKALQKEADEATLELGR
jgi:hypothetical protein